MKSLRKKTIATLLIAVFMVSMLASAMPISAASTILHVGADETYETISAALLVAVDGDTIIVHQGIYSEDLLIEADIELMPFEDDDVTIKGVAHSSGMPTNIEVKASGVKIHGFIIESPQVPPAENSGGLVVWSTNVEIYDNTFSSLGDAASTFCYAIQTLHQRWDGDVSGLQIYDNTFTGNVPGGYVGIYVNPEDIGTVTITNNVFSGTIIQGIMTEHDNTIIQGNVLTTDLTGYSVGIRAKDYGVESDGLISDVDISGNDVIGFESGIEVQGASLIDITGNTIDSNEVGVLVRSSADGVSVTDNNILSNSLYGVKNLDTVNSLVATNNWWGSTEEEDIVMYVAGYVDYSEWQMGDIVSEDEVATITAITTYPMVRISLNTYSVSFDDIAIGGWSQDKFVTVEHTGSEEITQTVSTQTYDDEDGDFYSLNLLVTSDPTELYLGDTQLFTLTLTVPANTVPGEYTGSLVFWASYAEAVS